ncbi:hypothetical protein F5Y04DRAFT_285112 [Hypomontagnella monticulosa]|nr:hypothetical protein F5Y04DRAFT_285112 [Hypomontagnella monticulosa]
MAEATIKRYFTKPPRFQFIKKVGQGEYAQAFQIQFNDPKFPHIKHFVVKQAWSKDVKEALQNEKTHLQWPDNSERMPFLQDEMHLSHNDIHDENVLLGIEVPDSEHGITPILKIIDFGMAQYVEGKDNQNIQDIGEIMLYLISLNTEFLHPNIPEKDLPEIVWAGRKIRTRATRIIPFKKGVDPALQTLICACLNYNDDRPSLKDLLLHAENAVTHPAASYRNKPEEQDDAISKFWKDVVFNPPSK